MDSHYSWKVLIPNTHKYNRVTVCEHLLIPFISCQIFMVLLWMIQFSFFFFKGSNWKKNPTETEYILCVSLRNPRLNNFMLNVLKDNLNIQVIFVFLTLIFTWFFFSEFSICFSFTVTSNIKGLSGSFIFNLLWSVIQVNYVAQF